jgi:hypothetical protein
MSEPTLRTIKCSLLESLLLKVPVPVVFVFDERLEPESLLAALRQTLLSFPHFSGRLRRTKTELFIDCNGLGPSTSIVHLKEDFETMLARLVSVRASELCEMIAPSRAAKGQAPLLTVRINQPRDGGTILGICWHHAVGDMATFMGLIVAWQKVARGETFQTPIIVPDRDAYFMSEVEEKGRVPSMLRRLSGGEIVRFLGYLTYEARKQELITVYFSDAELGTMRDTLQKEAGVQLSRNDALCAHLAAAICKLDPVRRNHCIAIPINMRARLGLSKELCGNVLGGTLVSADGAPFEIAIRIRHGVEHSATLGVDFFSSRRHLMAAGGMSAAWRLVPRSIDPMSGTLLMTSWRGFQTSDVEFQGKRTSGFAAVGGAPFPWLSSLFEGPRGRGCIYSAILPRRLGRALKGEASIKELHKYRTKGEERLPRELRRWHEML